MGDCVSPSAVSDFANKDINRIVGRIAEVLARKSPYMDVLDGGTLPNVSDVVRSVVQERAVVGTSLAAPQFQPDIEMCAGPVSQDQVGSTEYSYQLESMRGQGPRVCVKQARAAFKGSYLQAQQSMEKAILQIQNSDIRAQLLFRSGVKFNVNTNFGFSTCLTGDSQQINVPFLNTLPNSPLSFNIVYLLGKFLMEEMLAEPYTTQNDGEMLKFIGSTDITNTFRDELNIREDMRYAMTGQYKIGEKSIMGYRFEGPYRGIGFGSDTQPLRFNTITNGIPNFIEPEIAVVTTRGVAARRNPAWVQALYEVAFLIAPNSFKRLVPESYTGEGTFKFNPQLSMGELKWHYVIDNDCNKFGDFGQHIYQISRAFQPIRPQNVIPIIYARCPYNFDTVPCGSSGIGL
jgi:hypothetical protein